MGKWRERADRLQDSVAEHGQRISQAVEVNTTVIVVVGLVSLVALLVGVTALSRSRR
jgi:Co/Zn/Cd efflux system component